MEEKGESRLFFFVLSLGRDDEGKKKLLQLCPIITIQSVITGKEKKKESFPSAKVWIIRIVSMVTRIDNPNYCSCCPIHTFKMRFQDLMRKLFWDGDNTFRLSLILTFNLGSLYSNKLIMTGRGSKEREKSSNKQLCVKM